MATITIEQSFAALQDIQGDISDISTSNKIRMANRINRQIYKVLKDTDPSTLSLETTISVVSGTDSYTLPTDFRDMTDINNGLFLVNTDGTNSTQELILSSKGSSNKGYYLSGSSIFITPVPTSNYTLRLNYTPKITAMTALTDTYIIDDEWEEMITEGLIKEYHKFDRNPSEQQFAEVQFTNMLIEFIQSVSRTPKVYNMPSMFYSSHSVTTDPNRI